MNVENCLDQILSCVYDLKDYYKSIEKNQRLIHVEFNREKNVRTDVAQSEDLQLNNAETLEGAEENLKKGIKRLNGSYVRRVRHRKKGDVVYYQGCITNGERRLYLYGRTEDEIVQKIKLVNCQIKLGTYTLPEKKEKTVTSKTFASWYKIFYKTYRKGLDLREQTVRDYNAKMERILEYFGSKLMENIKEMHVVGFLNTIPQGSRRKYFDILNKIFKTAVANDVMRKNPLELAKRPSSEGEKFRAYEFEEQNFMLETLNDVDGKVFFFLCCTGLRIGEFLALTPADVNGNYLEINKSIDAHGKLRDSTKNKENRRVLVLPEIFDVFDKSLLGTFTSYNELSKRIRKAYRQLPKGLNLHSTRHTYASVAHFVGLQEKRIQVELGHKTLAMTQDIYTNLLRRGDSIILDYIKKLRYYIENCE